MDADKDWLLSYRYRCGDLVEVPGDVRLPKDERSVVLSVLKKHFDGVEAGAFKFRWLVPSPLDRALRGRPSGNDWKHFVLSLSTTTNPIGSLSDDERRLVYVRDVAACVIRELMRLASELGTGSVLTKMSRRRLTRHLLGLDLKNPTWPFDGMAAVLVKTRPTGDQPHDDGKPGTGDEGKGGHGDTGRGRRQKPAERDKGGRPPMPRRKADLYHELGALWEENKKAKRPLTKDQFAGKYAYKLKWNGRAFSLNAVLKWLRDQSKPPKPRTKPKTR